LKSLSSLELKFSGAAGRYAHLQERAPQVAVGEFGSSAWMTPMSVHSARKVLG
jgi:hypothetical protein